MESFFLGDDVARQSCSVFFLMAFGIGIRIVGFDKHATSLMVPIPARETTRSAAQKRGTSHPHRKILLL